MAAAGTRSRRLAAGAAFLAYAGLALGSGLDRASETRPDLARLVPPPLASEALRSAGRAAIARGDWTSARTLGEAAVADAPLDPSSTALLGAARYATGDRIGADRAFRVAARLGWRIPYTQFYMLGRALEIGDYRVASLRLDALARQNPGVLADRRLFDPFERSGPGRAALADRLVTGPPWLRPYAMAVTDLPPDRVAQRAAVLNALAQRGRTIGCRPVGAIASRLITMGAVADAAKLWRGHCPGAATSLLYDGTFAAAQLDQSESEFAWFFVGQSDASVVIEPETAPPARALVIDSTAPRPALVVRQLVLLAPGNYRLSWRAVGGSGVPADQVLAAFACEPDPQGWIAPQFDGTSRRWHVDLTMDGACPARWIGFAARPAASDVRLSDVRLEPRG